MDWHQKVGAIDTQNRTITLAPPHHYYGYRKGQRYYAVNVLAELDSPGEWYLDRQKGTLYLWPPEPIEKARIVFTTLESPMIVLSNASYVVIPFEKIGLYVDEYRHSVPARQAAQ